MKHVETLNEGLKRAYSLTITAQDIEARVAEELKAVFDPCGGAWLDGRYVPSLPAAIGGILERHMGHAHEVAEPTHAATPEAPRVAPAACPRCGAGALIRQGVSVGEGAVIGMGAVVVKDVAPGATVVGNPAREMAR